jgi:hypothetical protein
MCVIVKPRKMRRPRPPRGCRAIGKRKCTPIQALNVEVESAFERRKLFTSGPALYPRRIEINFLHLRLQCCHNNVFLSKFLLFKCSSDNLTPRGFWCSPCYFNLLTLLFYLIHIPEQSGIIYHPLVLDSVEAKCMEMCLFDKTIRPALYFYVTQFHWENNWILECDAMMKAEASSETSIHIYKTIHSTRRFSSLLQPREPQISVIFFNLMPLFFRGLMCCW